MSRQLIIYDNNQIQKVDYVDGEVMDEITAYSPAPLKTFDSRTQVVHVNHDSWEVEPAYIPVENPLVHKAVNAMYLFMAVFLLVVVFAIVLGLSDLFGGTVDITWTVIS
jgi:hypothetical protein